MSVITRVCERCVLRGHLPKAAAFYSNAAGNDEEKGEFRVLNLRMSRSPFMSRPKPAKRETLPTRAQSMPVDQDWGNVWPGPRTFHPATVPLPLRQGYVEKGAPPDKYANAELMKIPNFLHLTPPVIKRQCEALKKFCTPWPEALRDDVACDLHFPIEVTSSNYCHSSPTIRDPMARIITVRFKLAKLELDARAKDKFLRLVGERYDEATDYVTIVTDRCPLKRQNYDYAMYLITALYHESLNVEPWEALKSDADMEHYIWEKSASKRTLEAMFGKPSAEIPEAGRYTEAIDALMNEGESDYTLSKYEEAVRKLLGAPDKLES